MLRASSDGVLEKTISNMQESHRAEMILRSTRGLSPGLPCGRCGLSACEALSDKPE
jgi:hypothetical protein